MIIFVVCFVMDICHRTHIHIHEWTHTYIQESSHRWTNKGRAVVCCVLFFPESTTAKTISTFIRCADKTLDDRRRRKKRALSPNGVINMNTWEIITMPHIFLLICINQKWEKRAEQWSNITHIFFFSVRMHAYICIRHTTIWRRKEWNSMNWVSRSTKSIREGAYSNNVIARKIKIIIIINILKKTCVKCG